MENELLLMINDYETIIMLVVTWAVILLFGIVTAIYDWFHRN
jgi:hypothetical protein